MDAGQINSVKVTEAQQLGANAKPETIVSVQFKVGAHGPFVEIFPKVTFDANTANAKLQEFANKLALINAT